MRIEGQRCAGRESRTLLRRCRGKGRQFMDPALAELSAKERALIWDKFNRVIATLHSVDYVALGLGDEPTRPFVHSDLNDQVARQMEVREVFEDFSGRRPSPVTRCFTAAGRCPRQCCWSTQPTE